MCTLNCVCRRMSPGNNLYLFNFPMNEPSTENSSPNEKLGDDDVRRRRRWWKSLQKGRKFTLNCNDETIRIGLYECP